MFDASNITLRVQSVLLHHHASLDWAVIGVVGLIGLWLSIFALEQVMYGARDTVQALWTGMAAIGGDLRRALMRFVAALVTGLVAYMFLVVLQDYLASMGINLLQNVPASEPTFHLIRERFVSFIKWTMPSNY